MRAHSLQQISKPSTTNYLWYLYYIAYGFKRVSKLNQLDWDIQTITPGDYTSQYEITDKAYNWFLKSE
jgi:hypothetical protein